LKVLHLTHYFFPEYSGTSTRLYNIIHRLPYDVRLLAADRVVRGDIIPQKQEQFGNISVSRLPLVFGAAGQPNLPWQTLKAVRHDRAILTESALKESFDIIHAHNSIVFGQAAVEIAGRSGKPFITEYHGLSHDAATGALKPFKTWYIRRADKDVLRRSTHIVTLTNRLKEWLTLDYGIPAEKITVIPNGADTELFAPKNEYDAKAAELKNNLGIRGKVVMYAGIMDRINGIDNLAVVIPPLLLERPDICFVFIGGAVGIENLQALAAKYPENVKILASVSHDDMPYYYRMCDVFIIPRPSTISSETIVPLKVLEVMSAGKPVVASDVGGLAEVIEHGKNGYLFRKGDNASLKNTLLAALDADNTQLGIAARKTIVDNYTWQKSVAILVQLYEKLAGKG
jgi:glycosyltransferase involved in cell wall biosynthesis